MHHAEWSLTRSNWFEINEGTCRSRRVPASAIPAVSCCSFRRIHFDAPLASRRVAEMCRFRLISPIP
jgi:hypothetical protein